MQRNSNTKFFQTPHYKFIEASHKNCRRVFSVPQEHKSCNSAKKKKKKSINLVKAFFSNFFFQNYVLPTRLCSVKMSLNQRIPNAQKLLSTAATVAATAMLVKSIAYDYIPNDIQRYLSSHLHNLSRLFSSRFTIVIEEFQGL